MQITIEYKGKEYKLTEKDYDLENGNITLKKEFLKSIGVETKEHKFKAICEY